MPLSAVDAIVQPPRQAVHERLAVEPIPLVAEAREDDLAEVGHAVAVSILQIDDVRLEPHVDAAVVRKHGRRIAEPVREDGALLEPSVAVGVLEQADAPDALVEHQVAAGFGLIPAHLDDVETAVFVERHLNRIDHQRLVGDELQPEAFLDAEGLERLVGLDGRHVRNVLRVHLQAERDVRLARVQVPIASVGARRSAAPAPDPSSPSPSRPRGAGLPAKTSEAALLDLISLPRMCRSLLEHGQVSTPKNFNSQLPKRLGVKDAAASDLLVRGMLLGRPGFLGRLGVYLPPSSRSPSACPPARRCAARPPSTGSLSRPDRSRPWTPAPRY